MTLDQFIGLPADPDIDTKIAEQDRILQAVRQSSQIRAREALSEIVLPTLPDGFAALLGRTIANIAQDAETRLSQHLAAHGMQADGGNWIANGLDHTETGTCPFCGQSIVGLPLIAAYQAIFSAGYRALRADISAMRAQIDHEFGEGALGRLSILSEQNRGAVEFWQRFCAFDPAPLALPNIAFDAVRAVGQAAHALLSRKDQTPLDVVFLDVAFTAAVEAYEAAQSTARSTVANIQAVNTLIAAKKAEAGAFDVRGAEIELEQRRAIKTRHSDPVAGLCADHIRLTSEKKAIDDQKIEVRARLEEHTANVISPYEQRINQLLDNFNADFRITETRHGYPGGAAASNYRLIINNTAIEVGDGLTPPHVPSFKNTLSSGDRATLALAFFLAHLERDRGLANKTVVFDDPFNSQDTFRRRQTVHEIAKIGRSCAQVMVLSHDATFLKQVWDKAPPAERIAITLADRRAQGSKIMPVDLDRACQGRTAADIDGLQSFVTSAVGNPTDLIRKIRTVLETYCWTTYSGSFQAGQDWLGEIVRKIREGGAGHPAQPLYDELDQINDYIRQYYHGENLAVTTPDQIDPTELTGYTRRTLRIVNAIQA